MVSDSTIANLKEDSGVLHVLDLPQLYTKPSAGSILSALAEIQCELSSWENAVGNSKTGCGSLSGSPATFHESRRPRYINEDGLPRYLTSIISSPLSWIRDEAKKELIWESASQRLSERSGRTAMSALNRTFTIALGPDAKDSVRVEGTQDVQTLGNQHGPSLRIVLHEPALTADNLGLKTWASSYLLANRMATLSDTLPKFPQSAQILELGSGTGLVGIATAAIYRTQVVLTDLPDIVENLQRNCEMNATQLQSFNAATAVRILDWSRPAELKLGNGTVAAESFALILAADCCYSSEQPEIFVQTVAYHLSKRSDSRVVVAIPEREAFGNERNDFVSRMSSIGLAILQEGRESGFDDWSSGVRGQEADEVVCWWSVWAWKQ